MHLHSTLSLALAACALTMALPLSYDKGDLSKCYADAARSSDPNASMACEKLAMAKRELASESDLSKCYADAALSDDPNASMACEKLAIEKRDTDQDLSKCYADAARPSDPNTSMACERLAVAKRGLVDPDANSELSKCYADAALSSDPSASMWCEKLATTKRGIPEHHYDLSKCLADARDPYAAAACGSLSHSRKRDVNPELSKCLADAALSSDPNASKKCEKLPYEKRSLADADLGSDYDYRVCLAAAAESTDPRASEKCEEKYKNRGAQQQVKPTDHCSTQIAQARESIEYSCRLTDGAVGQGEFTRAQACVRLNAPDKVDSKCRKQMIEESATWVDRRMRIKHVQPEAPFRGDGY